MADVELSTAVSFLLIGAVNTLWLTAGSIAIGFVLGFFVGWMRSQSAAWLYWPATVFVNVIRGTPRLLIVLFAAFLPPLIGIRDISFAPLFGIVALGISSAAYQAEIFRSGFQAVPTGQIEAAQAVGMTYWQGMRYVVLPQTVRTIFPALSNEFMIVLKDTSLLFLLGVVELTAQGRFLQSLLLTAGPIFYLFIGIATIYFVITFTISRFMRFFENRYKVPGIGVVAA